MLNPFRPFLHRLRDKWQEIPVNNGRMFSRDLLKLEDEPFLRAWQDNNSSHERQWYRDHYGSMVKGKDVLDLGCGFSVDGIHFAKCGARVTFADIVEDNLAVTRRVVAHFGLPAEYYYIDSVKRFRLPHDYDFIFAIGSLHHSPFALAQKEVAAVARFLRPGGLFLLFTYPKERFMLSGANDFGEFGRKTDGERTPWAEWYDDAKIRKLFGPGFELRWSKNFGCHDEPDFNWFEVAKQ